MLRVGIIAEGSTDFMVLEEVMKAVTSDVEFVHIHPATPVGSGLGNGWRGVKAWCQENGPELETYLTGVRSRPLSLLIIHADCSMADKVGAHRPCPPASDTAEALKEVIERSWLCRNPLPGFVVLATPALSSDAWVVATLDPPFANLAGIECDKGAEDELIRRRLLEKKSDGRPRKQASKYAPIAARIGQSIDHVCTHCTQAEVFRSDFRAAIARSSPTQAS